MARYVIKVYVANDEVSIRAVRELKQALTGTDFRLNVIDVRKHPGKAEKDNIIVTPTTIKELPPPFKKVLGVISGKQKVLMSLDIPEKKKRMR
jgi:circadian clock protein KaiB